MIYIVGDTHGEIDHWKLNTSVVKKNCNEYPQYVIVLGDFGFIWENDPKNEREIYWLNWLEKKPWTTLFIDGNHENHHRLNNYHTVNMFGSEVGQISDKIFHLKRGNIYYIEDKTFFCMGGAESTDKHLRKAYIDWWPEEISFYRDYYNAINNLQKVNYKVDYVLTHTAPKSIIEQYYNSSGRYKDPTSEMLEDIKNKVEYKKWFHGHMHEDKYYDHTNIYGVYDKYYII